jgi:hypothetical protein
MSLHLRPTALTGSADSVLTSQDTVVELHPGIAVSSQEFYSIFLQREM